MTKERAYFEATTLRKHGGLSPDHVPQVYHFDRTMALIGMRYLEPPHIILSKGLVAGIQYPFLAEHMSDYMAKTLFFTSLLYHNTTEHRRAVTEFCGNVELCRLTEQVVFSDPYRVSTFNRWTSPYLDDDAKAVREDSALKLEIVPFLIFGADVTHPQAGEDSSPSIDSVHPRRAQEQQHSFLFKIMRSPMMLGGQLFGRSSLQSVGLQRQREGAAANSQPIEPREEVVPVERDFRVLHPSRRNGAKWFKNNTELSTRVRKIIEGCFKGPWYSWRKVPQFYKDAWYSTFKTKYEWHVSIEALVKANFDKLAATRLKGMVSLAKSNGEKPDWILSEYWREMSDYWKTPKAKEKSEKARAARLFDRDGLGPHSHRSGSRSYAKVQDNLIANNEDSSFIAVLKKTHQKSDGSYGDEKARLIAKKYDEYVQERLSQVEPSNGEVLMDSLTVEERNEIYVKVAGITKQGRVFGLGSLQSGVCMPLDGSSGSPQAVEDDGTLTHRVKELESELQKSNEEKVQFQNRIEAMEKILKTAFGENVLTPTDASPLA